MVQIEALRPFVLGIDDKRVSGDFGAIGTLYWVPQQCASEFQAMIGESDGKAAQPRDGYRRIAWRASGEPGRHLREEYPARG